MQLDIDLMPSRTVEPATESSPAIQTATNRGTRHPCVVIVYDDDWHTFTQVEEQLQKAIGCSLEKAEALAVEIDSEGRCIVFGGSETDCDRVANILREIRLQVETVRS